MILLYGNALLPWSRGKKNCINKDLRLVSHLGQMLVQRQIDSNMEHGTLIQIKACIQPKGSCAYKYIPQKSFMH
jgi:hypothetical protein